jgi:hypothetical protein
MAKPISPKEVQSVKDTTIPDEIIEVFNALIIKNWNGHAAHFTQDEAMDESLKTLKVNGKDITRSMIFEYRWLDVEPMFRKQGWNVKFDKPAYNETYDANFTFSKE